MCQGKGRQRCGGMGGENYCSLQMSVMSNPPGASPHIDTNAKYVLAHFCIVLWHHCFGLGGAWGMIVFSSDWWLASGYVLMISLSFIMFSINDHPFISVYCIICFWFSYILELYRTWKYFFDMRRLGVANLPLSQTHSSGNTTHQRQPRRHKACCRRKFEEDKKKS